jgi:anti-sigma28 factor (negative regulator of flagellin synthesis)
MNKKVISIGAGVVAIVAVVAFASTTSAASDMMKMKHGTNATSTHATSTKIKMMKDVMVKEESVRAARKAVEDGDYAAFQKAVAKFPKAAAITESQFQTLVQAQKILVDAGLAPRVVKPIMKIEDKMKQKKEDRRHGTSTSATSTESTDN